MPTAKRTSSRASLALPFQLRLVHKKSWGHRLRDFISGFLKSCRPIAKYVFPNFIVVHYIYLITLSIIGSILLYPCKNTAFIDVLFLAAGASTQGGLATKSTNDFNLYQQIVVYVITLLSTPILIHGFLAFVRLYWFERYFDNIRDISKQNFKLRRTMTCNKGNYRAAVAMPLEVGVSRTTCSVGSLFPEKTHDNPLQMCRWTLLTRPHCPQSHR